MTKKEQIIILLDSEESVKNALGKIRESLSDLIGDQIIYVLKGKGEQNIPDLMIEQIVSKTNTEGYTFDDKRIGEALTNLIKKGKVEFRQDYTYRLNKNPRKNY